jgi:U2-associated protein SR140
MKAFQFPGGMQKKPVNKKELEDQRKKDDEHAAAKAFEEYMEVFQETPRGKAPSKVWIKAGTYEAGKKRKYVNRSIIQLTELTKQVSRTI